MLKNYVLNSQKNLTKNNTNFYSPEGLHVYFNEPILNDDINVEKVISKVEGTIPSHLRDEVEMIIFGHFKEFDERSINAFYKDGALYISNIQDDEEDLYDDIVHEIAHSVEESYGYEIYADQKIKNEFLAKRRRLYDILWASGFKIPKSLMLDSEYNLELDKIFLEKIGYDKLESLSRGLFINPYSITSLREYFATLFTDYYLTDNHNFLKNVSPRVYEKILSLNNDLELDT